MRNVTVTILAVALAAACGSPAQQGSVTEQSETELSSTSTSAPADDSATTTTTADTTPGERPVAYPEDGFPSEVGSQPRLSIEDALLPDNAFGAPWEMQWRQLDAVGFGAGPNQTDCDDYWAYEELLGGDGGHVMWWIDGGNANHRVTRVENQGEALARLVALGAIADTCPVVNWNEGGSFTVELFTPDVDALIMRFDDTASGEVTWVAVTLFGDLVSVMQIPLWTRADGTMIEVTLDEMTAVAAEMAQRLHDAGPDRSPPPTTTNPKIPTIVAPPPPTTFPDVPTIVAPPPPVAPTTTVALDSLGELLLTAAELPDGWEFSGIEPSSPGGSDDALIDACPAAQSLNDIDDALLWEASFRTLAGREALQLIGDTDDPAVASALVQRFADVASCDLSSLFADAVESGGLVEISGADAAGTLFIELPDQGGGRLELGAAAVGSIVVVFTIDAAFDGAEPDRHMLDFISRGVAKIDAARS